MTEVIGYVGAVFLALSSAPQLYTTLKTKDVSGLSLPMLLLWGFGCVFMGIYIYLTTQQIPALLNYSVNTTLVFTNIFLYFLYKKK